MAATPTSDSSYQTDLNRVLAAGLAQSHQRIGDVAEIIRDRDATIQRQAEQIQKLRAAIEIAGEKYFPQTDRGRKVAEMIGYVRMGTVFNPFHHLSQEDATSLCNHMYAVGRTRYAKIWMLHSKWGELAFCGRYDRYLTEDLKLRAIARFAQERISDFEKL